METINFFFVTVTYANIFFYKYIIILLNTILIKKKRIC